MPNSESELLKDALYKTRYIRWISIVVMIIGVYGTYDLIGNLLHEKKQSTRSTNISKADDTAKNKNAMTGAIDLKADHRFQNSSNFNEGSNSVLHDTVFDVRQTIRLDIEYNKPLSESDTIVVITRAVAAPVAVSDLNSPNADVLPITAAGVHFNPFQVVNGKLVLNTDVYDAAGNLIVSMRNNACYINPGYHGNLRYDNRGFEILDSLGNVALGVTIPKASKEKFPMIITGYVIRRELNSITIMNLEGAYVNTYRSQKELFSDVRNNPVPKLFVYDNDHRATRGERSPVSP